MSAYNPPILLGGKEVPLRETARAANLSASYISLVLSGRRDFRAMSVSNAMQLARVLGYSSVESLEMAILNRWKSRSAAA